MAMSVRRWAGVAACAFVALFAVGRDATAQNRLLTAGIGGVAGLTAGGYISLSIIVARARHGDYVYALNDVLGWGSVPVLLGAGTGAAVGYLDPPRLLRTVVGGTAGTLLGLGAGLVIGRSVWPPPEGKWAGAAIGAGAGLVLGSVVGLLWPGGTAAARGEATTSPRAARVPIGLTLRL
ncbi:MAG: hypothetical protein IRZ00_05090 [Gemmatimonadetes bacterium]|nr:hypothetical protein [Gemmatimonadota bacterium]